jgi:hypothetical protein
MNKLNMVYQNQNLETEERTLDDPEARYAEMKWFFDHWQLLAVAIQEATVLK